MQQIGLDLKSYSLIISNWKVIKIFFPSPVAQCSPYSVLYEKNNQIEVEEEKRHYWLLLNSHIIKLENKSDQAKQQNYLHQAVVYRWYEFPSKRNSWKYF